MVPRVDLRYELDEVAQVPCLAAENKPGGDVRHFLLDGLEHGLKLVPLGREFGVARLGKDVLVVEESRHRHVGADAERLALVDVGAGELHLRAHPVPELVQIGQVHVFPFVHKPLLIGGHDVGHLVGGKLDLDDIARILLVFLFHHDAILRRVEILDDLVHHVNGLDLSGEQFDVHDLAVSRSGRSLAAAASGGRCAALAAGQQSAGERERQSQGDRFFDEHIPHPFVGKKFVVNREVLPPDFIVASQILG